MDGIVRLVKWLSDNPKIQRRLFDSEYCVSPEECLEIMELLEQNGFYEMIVVLLMRNRENPVLSEAMSKLAVDQFVCEWKRVGTERIYTELKDNIRAEMRLKENKDTAV